MTVKIVVADDMDLALEGIKTILRQYGAFHITGTHRVLADLLDALAAQPPEVILLGDQLEPGMDVLALVERVRQAAPRARLLVMGSLPDGLIVQELLICGVAGFLYKSDSLAACRKRSGWCCVAARISPPRRTPNTCWPCRLAVRVGSWTPKDARCCVSSPRGFARRKSP